MARGGARSGAGRKPREKRGVVLGMDGARRVDLRPAVSPEEQSALLKPPDELSATEKAVWLECAPLALEERTLTPSKVPGFREFCTRLANVRALDARIQVLGVATQDALRYSAERRGWATLLAASLKDFKLTAFGKPATSEKPKQAVNPFAALGAQKSTG